MLPPREVLDSPLKKSVSSVGKKKKKRLFQSITQSILISYFKNIAILQLSSDCIVLYLNINMS